MKETIHDGQGPGAEVHPALDAAYDALKAGLKAVGRGNAIFAIVCLLPDISDREGYDVVRMASNLPGAEVPSFIRHLALTINPPDSPQVRVLSLQQAVQEAVQRLVDTEPKKGTH